MKVSGPGPPGPGPGGRFLSQKSPPAPPPRNNWGPCGGAYRGLGSQQNFTITHKNINLLYFLCSLFCGLIDFVYSVRVASWFPAVVCAARGALPGLRLLASVSKRRRSVGHVPAPGRGARARGPGGRPGRPGGPAGPAPGRGAPGGPRRDPGSGPGYLKFYNEVHYKMLNK